MSTAKPKSRGPCYQMYADRALNSGRLQRLTWEQQGLFYWILNRSWVDGGVPKDPKVLSAMMPGGPKSATLAKVLELFTVQVGENEVTHEMHVEQQARHVELSKKKTSAANKRWGNKPSGNAPAHAHASAMHQKIHAQSMPSQPLNLSRDISISKETSTSPPEGCAAGGEAEYFPEGFPVSAEAARQAAAEVGVPVEYAETVWLEVRSSDFQDRYGRPVTHWPSFILSTFRRREEYRTANPKEPKKTEGETPNGKNYNGM